MPSWWISIRMRTPYTFTRRAKMTMRMPRASLVLSVQIADPGRVDCEEIGAMNPVCELLGVDDIQLDVDVPDKARLLQRIAALLSRRQGLSEARGPGRPHGPRATGLDGSGSRRRDSARAHASVRRSSRRVRANEGCRPLRRARRQTCFDLSGAAGARSKQPNAICSSCLPLRRCSATEAFATSSGRPGPEHGKRASCRVAGFASAGERFDRRDTHSSARSGSSQ